MSKLNSTHYVISKRKTNCHSGNIDLSSCFDEHFFSLVSFRCCVIINPMKMMCRISTAESSTSWRCGICREKLLCNVQYRTISTTNSKEPSLKGKEVVLCLACNFELPLKYNILFLLNELALHWSPFSVCRRTGTVLCMCQICHWWLTELSIQL